MSHFEVFVHFAISYVACLAVYGIVYVTMQVPVLVQRTTVTDIVRYRTITIDQ